MCVNLMKIHGVKKIYYSDSDGNICCEKVSQCEDDMYASHGLKLLISRCVSGGLSCGQKLPLTKSQKKHLYQLIKEEPRFPLF